MVEAEEGDIEEEEGEVVQGEAASFGEVFEATPEHGEGVFGAVEEDGPFGGDLELSECGVSAGDGERELGGEVGFADLGVSAEDADAGLEPEGLDEPSVLRRHGGDLADVARVEGLGGRAIPRTVTNCGNLGEPWAPRARRERAGILIVFQT